MRCVAGLMALMALIGAWAVGALAEEEWDGWEEWRRSAGLGSDSRRGATYRGADGFSDEAVKQAIQRGCRFLWSQRSPDGGWPSYGGGQRKYVAGPASLAAYALLASGVSPLDKRMEKTLEWLSKQETQLTYTLGLRCNVWLLANRETSGKYMPMLRKDAAQLYRSTRRGAYNYFSRGDRQSHGDNSNSQYGVLGTWAGKMAYLEIPNEYWALVMDHWRNDQQSDGGWGYRGNQRVSATMTAAGVATLFVCFDSLYADRFIRCNVSTDYAPIRRGLEWMDKNFNAAVGGGALMGHGDLYYFLYGVERVGLASGYKYFGKTDWYKLGARELLARQRGDGSWKGKRPAVVGTAFAILFLVRGQHAVAFNKLEFKGDWNNRPRDLAGLTRWLTGAFERTLNWQIINLKVPVEEWHDAPILYLSASKEPEFSEKELEKLRKYVWQGGTIFSVTECNGSGFSRGIRKVYQKLFPKYPLRRVARDHPLYTIHAKIAGWPSFYEIHNGVRTLVIHTDKDLPKSWQLQLKSLDKRSFQAPANVLMYVTDMGALRHRGVSHWPPKPAASPARKIKLARLKYAGNWDPEPLAFERFRRLMVRGANVDLEVISPVEIGDLEGTGAKIATMTGTERFTLTGPQTASLKRFVENGGTLIIDAAGGSRAFSEAAEVMLADLFGRRAIRRLATPAPLYRLAGMEIKKVSYRRKAKVSLGGRRTPNLRAVQIAGRSAVIFSKEDITGGLVGCPCYTSVGYRPDSCVALMRNAVIYADRMAAKPRAAAAAQTRPARGVKLPWPLR